MTSISSISLLSEAENCLRVLIVEDVETDAIVATAAVKKAMSGPVEILRADTLAKALGIIWTADVHLVLLDLNLPDSRGLETLKRARAATACPIIVITSEDRPGLDDEV